MNKNNARMQHDMGGGFISDVIMKVRLVIKLMQDDHIDMLLKAIPVFCLIYLVVPFDLIIGPVDDAVVLYLGMDLFINLCPQDIVNNETSRKSSFVRASRALKYPRLTEATRSSTISRDRIFRQIANSRFTAFR